MRALLLLSALGLWGHLPAGAIPPRSDELPAPVEVGTEVPPFYVREINGERPNLAVCLVCKNGDRPVILISVRKLTSDVEQLIAAVDRRVDAHRADGLRGFVVFLDADRKELQPRLFSLAKEQKWSLPLTLPVESITGPSFLQHSEQTETMVVLYEAKRVAASFSFRTGELTGEKTEQVFEQVDRVLLHRSAATDRSASTP